MLPNIDNETEALKVMPKGRLAQLKRLLPMLQNQSEDCLYLNVYCPTTGESSLLCEIIKICMNLGETFTLLTFPLISKLWCFDMGES